MHELLRGKYGTAEVVKFFGGDVTPDKLREMNRRVAQPFSYRDDPNYDKSAKRNEILLSPLAMCAVALILEAQNKNRPKEERLSQLDVGRFVEQRIVNVGESILLNESKGRPVGYFYIDAMKAALERDQPSEFFGDDEIVWGFIVPILPGQYRRGSAVLHRTIICPVNEINERKEFFLSRSFAVVTLEAGKIIADIRDRLEEIT